MKKPIYLLAAVLLGIMVTTWYSCEGDPEESCFQDEICEGQEVTACCTEDVCVFTYNGKDYTEDEKAQLIEDLGCAPVGLLKSSDMSALYNRLNEILAKARAGLKK